MQRKDCKDNSINSDISALSQLALQHYRDGHLQQAQDACQRILREEQRPDAMLILGMIAHEQKEFQLAAEHYRQFLEIVPDHAQTHFNLGLVLEELGRTGRAIERYKKAIAIASDDVAVHRQLGDAYCKLQRWGEAIEAYQQALAIEDSDVETLMKLGSAFDAARRWPESIPPFEQALALQPDNALAHRRLGAVLQAMGQIKRALECFEKVLILRPEDIDARIDLASVLRQLGRAEEAQHQFEQVLRCEPGHIGAHIELVQTLRQMGQTELAVQRLKQFLDDQPACGEAYHQISMMRPERQLIPVVEKIIRKPELSDNDAIYCHFSLGNFLNSSESYDQAFSHFRRANELYRKTFVYDHRENAQLIDQLIEVYDEEYFQDKVQFGSSSPLPVFIVGMPRAGTTLVEQIISSHALVYGAGELQALPGINLAIAQQLRHVGPRPQCMAHIDRAIAEKYSAQYLEELVFHCPSASRIVDKFPENFARIGLIKTLFPHARIINCQRNPLDNCLSLFFHCFKPFKTSFELTELGRYYLDYQRVMSHWHKLFPGEIFNLQYEELVLDQEKLSRQLIDYIGLQWDAQCMEFHANERSVMSPSNTQVRQPMYSSSIDRWKNYRAHVQPLIEVLEHAD